MAPVSKPSKPSLSRSLFCYVMGFRVTCSWSLSCASFSVDSFFVLLWNFSVINICVYRCIYRCTYTHIWYLLYLLCFLNFCSFFFTLLMLCLVLIDVEFYFQNVFCTLTFLHYLSCTMLISHKKNIDLWFVSNLFLFLLLTYSLFNFLFLILTWVFYFYYYKYRWLFLLILLFSIT